MASDDLDLISLFGLSPEEAGGLGLVPAEDRRGHTHGAEHDVIPFHDAHHSPPSAEHDAGFEGLPEHAEPAIKAPGRLHPVGEVSSEDERALLELLEGNATRMAELSGFGATRGLSLADTVAGSQKITPAEPPTRAGDDAGPPAEQHRWQVADADDADEQPAGVAPVDGGLASGGDDPDLVELFRLSATDAERHGLADGAVPPFNDGTSAGSDDVIFPTMPLHAMPSDGEMAALVAEQQLEQFGAASGGMLSSPHLVEVDGLTHFAAGDGQIVLEADPSPVPAAHGAAGMIDPDLLDAFSEESTELLDGLHVELERLEADVNDHGALLEVRRIIHTLKGGAKMCGFEQVVNLTHASENLLDLVADGEAIVEPPMMHALFECAPMLRATVQAAIGGQAIDAEGVEELVARFDQLCAATAAAKASALASDDVTAIRGDAPEEIAVPAAADAAFSASTNDDDEVEGASRIQSGRAIPDAAAGDEPAASSPADGPPTADRLVELPALDAAQLLHAAPPEPAIHDDSEAIGSARPDTTGDRSAERSATHILRPASGSWLPHPALPRAVSVPPAEQAPRPPGRRGPNSINVDIGKVDAVVAKLTEMAAHRVSSQGMLGRLLETAEDARRNVTRLRSLVMQLGNECATIQPEDVKDDDLNLESYNTLNTLILQLQEAISDQQALVHSIHDTITSHWSLQAMESRIDADIHSALMSIRLVPVANMRVRLDSVVRQAAEATGKTVRWQLQGGSVAVEKNVFDRLFEPLMHLLRNAVDHGIETPAGRRDAGKPESGVITVAVSQEGSQVIISVSDDGAGIVPNKIAAIAVERGLVTAEVANGMSYEQKMALIFMPGFSTASAVSHLSGRGVGMDAVREACLRMGGSVDVSSRPGIGTTFTMRLPLSLSVTRGLIIRDGGALMALPVTQVVALHLVPAPDVAETPRGRVARIEGQELPVYNLTPLPGASPASYIQNGEVNVLQVAHEGGSIGLLIEDVVGEEEILIKTPPAMLQGVKQLLGAHVLPDGKVVPVVNLPQMLLDLRPVAMLMPPKEVLDGQELTALVVDDSMSMRVALSGTLRSAGFKVLTARDGQEALEVLKREGLPSIITLDVEMPRMDGLETLFAIRQMSGAQDLPVFMMTSRGGTKHRRAAEQLGATRYFTKPYRDSELASAARSACSLPVSAA